MKSAIILCSGGIDSVTTAFLAKKKLGYTNLTFLFFDYGQRNLNAEKKASQYCAKKLKAEFKEIKLPELANLSTSQLNTSKKPAKISSLRNTEQESQKWYVPCRNTVFLSYALAYADSIFIKTKRKSDIFIGFKNEGKEWYPDTTPQFMEDINHISRASMSQPAISAPLIKLDKEDIILLAGSLGVELERTFSCYSSNTRHCGICLSCQLRKSGFYWAGIKDNTKYREK